jgi:hypothetical protein
MTATRISTMSTSFHIVLHLLSLAHTFSHTNNLVIMPTASPATRKTETVKHGCSDFRVDDVIDGTVWPHISMYGLPPPYKELSSQSAHRRR